MSEPYLALEDIAVTRKRAGVTQADLAEAVGVSQSYVARLERGTLDPKLSVVRRIYDYLSSIRGKTCGDVMTRNPLVIGEREPASLAAKLMVRRAFSQLPVVRGGVAVGLVEERDIIRNINRDLDSMSVAAIMGRETPPKADEQTSLDSVFPLFETFQAILVEKDGLLTGILTRSDLMRVRQPRQSRGNV